MSDDTEISFPEPTREERTLQEEQVNILRSQQALLAEQQRRQELLSPLLFEAAGIRPVLDDEGQVVSFERVEPTEEEQLLQDLQLQALQQLAEPPEVEVDPLAERRQAIESALLTRSEQALAGELPVPTGIEQGIAEQEQQLRTQLRAQLGPGFETSSPGIEALQRFRESAALVRDEARRGEITLAEGLGLARGAANLGQRAFAAETGRQRLGDILTFGEAGRAASAARQARLGGGAQQALGTSLSLAEAFGGSAAGLSPVLAARERQRANIFEAQQLEAARPDPLLGAVGTLVGTAAGAFTGGAGAGLAGALFD